ncbi:hypothetical protein [Fontivita pretiosa]|uniref:hypothetical protein n=1 Tax=Fontivita pretiosa TaxID=2989684 RepID=UPI003D165BD9
MLTCRSPRKVMREAYHLARCCLPLYSSKYSRKDFTLPQLLACLCVKEMLHRSYRQAEQLLGDCENWLRDVGLRRAPDHNTLWRADVLLLKKLHAERLLDTVARWAANRRLLKTKRSRRRCGYTQGWQAMPAGRQAETANSMIKRNTGSALRAKTRCGRLRDLRRKVITHNVMILRNEGRDRAGRESLFAERAGAIGKTLVYDAWNRLVAYKNGSTPLATYEYDAVYRRIEVASSSSRLRADCSSGMATRVRPTSGSRCITPGACR